MIHTLSTRSAPRHRHEHIGKGAISVKGFELLVNDTRFEHIPKILETPKSEDLHEDVENMRILRSLVKWLH
ncbi:MAG: hypothetical protein NTV54_09100 [Ignavibacteriales bacterium]|nr:hypothetical protein [Ignavibacteriales bacterium]